MMTSTEQASKPRKGLLIWLIISQVLGAASLLLWLVMAGLSFMAFDSGESPQAWAFVITVWSYPIFPILMAIGAWIAYARRKDTLSAILSGLTFALPILLFLVLVIVSAAEIL
jgi:hypothetical protein